MKVMKGERYLKNNNAIIKENDVFVNRINGIKSIFDEYYVDKNFNSKLDMLNKAVELIKVEKNINRFNTIEGSKNAYNKKNVELDYQPNISSEGFNDE